MHGLCVHRWVAARWRDAGFAGVKSSCCACHPVLQHTHFKSLTCCLCLLLPRVLPHSTPLTTRKHTRAAVIVWLAVSVVLDLPSALLGSVLGLQLAPSMNAPLASASLADFWGRRYNRAVSAVLRFTVYEPLLQLLGCECVPCVGGRSQQSQQLGGTSRGIDAVSNLDGASPHNSSNCSQQQPCQQQQPGIEGQHSSNTHCCAWRHIALAVATTATFAVSGLMHELATW